MFEYAQSCFTKQDSWLAIFVRHSCVKFALIPDNAKSYVKMYVDTRMRIDKMEMFSRTLLLYIISNLLK